MAPQSQMSLVMARGALIAFPFRHLMERNKRGEVALSCMFQLWKMMITAKRWRTDQPTSTDVSKKDVEGNLPTMLESKTSAASFACVEALGVTMPPSEGWKPRAAGGGEEEENAEWWAHPKNPDWIYQSSEGMYFHLITGTLWERRDVECVDKQQPRHTYFRVDAVHLQALAQFAQSMESALVPMAWKAWVHYTRKKSRQGIAPASSPAGGKSRKKSADGKSSPQQTSPGGSKDAEGARQKRGPTLPTVPDEAEVKLDDQQGADVLLALGKTDSALSGTAALRPQYQSSQAGSMPLPISENAALRGFSKGEPDRVQDAGTAKKAKKKGSCLWACFGCRRKSGYDEDVMDKVPIANSRAPPASPPQIKAPGIPSGAQPKDAAPATAKTPTKAEVEDSARSKGLSDRSSARVDTDERHGKRLTQFMDDVKKNPQRLVTHVDRRRAEKTYLAFIVA